MNDHAYKTHSQLSGIAQMTPPNHRGLRMFSDEETENAAREDLYLRLWDAAYRKASRDARAGWLAELTTRERAGRINGEFIPDSAGGIEPGCGAAATSSEN